MAGSRIPGPICAHNDPANLRDGVTMLAPSSGPGTVPMLACAPQMVSDVSSRFSFREWSTARFSYKEASGELGIPGQVMTHRDRRAQSLVSAGTGEHAGHLIGIQFGAPGDARNLGLQNPNMNTFAPKELQPAFVGPGGSYHELESAWKDLLLEGWRIHVIVTDMYRLGENRPFNRHVAWTEISRSGETNNWKLDFGNFSSPQKRAAGA